MPVVRQDELDRIAAEVRHGRSVAVIGAAGIGKTTLARAAAGPTALIGGGLASLTWLPYLPFRRALERDPPAGDAPHVAAWVVEHARDAIVVLDDLQWADPETLAVLPHLRARTALLLAIRTGDPGTERALEAAAAAGALAVELQPLARADAAAVVRHAFPSVEPDALDRVLDSASGNPLLLRELARGRSPTLERSLRTRLRRASEAARHSLNVLALLGRPAPCELAGEGVEELLAADLVEVRDGTVAIRHDLLADPVLADLSPAARTELHAWLAARIADDGEAARHYAAAGLRGEARERAIAAADAAAHPAERARHLALAAACSAGANEHRLRLDAAAAYLAADRPADALGALPRFRRAAPEMLAEAALLRARARNALGDIGGCLRAVAGGLRFVAGSDTRLELLLLIEHARARRVSPTRASRRRVPDAVLVGIDVATDAVALARLLQLEEPGVDLLVGSELYVVHGSEDCIAYFRRARDGARAAGDLAIEMDAALLVVAAHYAFRGPVEAIAEAEALAERARGLGLDGQQAIARWQVARTRQLSWGDLTVVPELCRLSGDPAFGPQNDLLRMDSAVGLADLGRHADAERVLDPVRTPPRTSHGLALLYFGQSETRWLAHDLHGAVAAAEEALACETPLVAHFAALVRGWAQLELGLMPQALEHPPPAFGFTSSAGAELRGLVALAKDETVAAEEAFVEAAGGWHDALARLELRCRWGAGEAARRGGRIDAACRHLLHVEAEAERLGHVALLERIRSSLRAAGVHRAAPRRRDARGLTERELAVLALVAEGLTTREIAARLSVTPPTVETLLASARRRLGARTRVEAVALLAGGRG
jgi:DNA-binding CsgD family transcriptional regulator